MDDRKTIGLVLHSLVAAFGHHVACNEGGAARPYRRATVAKIIAFAQTLWQRAALICPSAVWWTGAASFPSSPRERQVPIRFRPRRPLRAGNGRRRLHRLGTGKNPGVAGMERLLLLDTSEINSSELQSQLTRTHRSVSFEVALGSIGDAHFLDELFRRHPVDLIYHAAGWKQVPLLESHPFSAVRNNALGTHTLAQAAQRGGVEKLVLISTDKAVNPSSIMGVSKRIAELVVVSLATPRAG